jgi:hypothetical protein
MKDVIFDVPEFSKAERLDMAYCNGLRYIYDVRHVQNQF